MPREGNQNVDSDNRLHEGIRLHHTQINLERPQVLRYRTRLKRLCCKTVFVLNPSGLFCANPVISMVELICLVLRCPLLSCTLVVLGREAWKALTCGNQVLDNALREPAGRWESEGIGFMLAKDYRKAQKRRRGSSGDAVKDEGRVLHHLCWADDVYAMAGTMNHLTRILEDMTKATERLGMRWKEKKSYTCCWVVHGVQTWRCC